MDFRLLGPLEVVDDDRVLELGGIKPRSLLALLLLHANQVVSADRLIAELWGDEPPATASKSVQVQVSRLRKELGEGRLATRAPGYAMHVDAAELDLARFEALVREARDAVPEEAARMLRDALALWRGAPLADLAYEPFAQTEVARLEELRLAALELRIDADLARGQAAELVAELEALVAEHPLRERMCGQLMLALYRSARQADALAAYQTARTMLSGELGLEPGEELRRLEQAILRHDPALELRPQPVSAGPSEPQAPDRAILVAPGTLDRLPALLDLVLPLAAGGSRHELLVACVVEPERLGTTSAALTERAEELRAGGSAVRSAVFASQDAAEDIVRLATQHDVDLLLLEAGARPLEGDAARILDGAPCDVALLVAAGGPPGTGAVVVPFGAGWHDWSALELGAWLARATGSPLRLIGAAGGENGRDASRLLADASLIVQRQAGIAAEPLLGTPGRHGIAALAEDAGLLVVGLSERWRQEGLGHVRTELVTSPRAPTVLVRRGPRPGGLAPERTRTRFGWSLTRGAP